MLNTITYTSHLDLKTHKFTGRANTLILVLKLVLLMVGLGIYDYECDNGTVSGATYLYSIWSSFSER